jgi:Fur family ferric uptake transcriptional regulator
MYIMEQKETRHSSKLIKNGCRNTKPRMAIIDTLENANIPLSAEDIYIKLKQDGNAANLSTVYRTLELLVNNGMVLKDKMNDNRARFKLAGDRHSHHLVCTSCHKIVELGLCPLELLEKDIKMATKFNITGHKLELYGLCPECKSGKSD